MSKLKNSEDSNFVKPFLKWAGGKKQLLDRIEQYYPFDKQPNITKYAEPFVGGGAVLFDILSKYSLEQVYISDVNAELITTYKAIRDDVDNLVKLLKSYEETYLNLDSFDRQDNFYEMRDRFNKLKKEKQDTEVASLMLFLNKTCFNGLYRVNKKGDYNVPMGKYANPQICNEENLRADSEKLKNVQIVCADYRDSINFIDNNTFVYFDPPYRPLTQSASFVAYAEGLFNDKNQLELAQYVQELDKKGAKILVSNSDPKNVDENDNFFDDAYSKQTIKRVSATRMINSKGSSRGKINELLISNF